jgi:putative transcriptional regulator
VTSVYYIDSIVRDTRLKLNMSQTQFASRFGFNITTLRQWEQGRRHPPSSVRILLAVIASAPDAVDQVVAPTRAFGLVR